MKLFGLLPGLLPLVLAVPAKRDSAPTVAIPSPAATIIGSTSSSVDSFEGVPFAQPPTGSLRLKPPQALTSLGTVTATDTPTACPQLYFDDDLNSSDWPVGVLGTLLNTPLFQNVTNAGEDCLTVSIYRPAGTTDTSNLPVLFWIFGGAFELGTGKPIVFVAVNYRLGGFGFLGGSEILADGSSNLGLLDQRLGLQWVQDNIASFGGDPTQVTIWGESAGAISVLDHMILYDGDNTYNGKPLFRAGIMDSGSVIPADPVDCPKAQNIYDTVVKTAGCSGATSTLDCLRGVDYETFLGATNSVPSFLSYTSIELSYLPRPDGKVLTLSPELLIKNGTYAKVPFIIGDQEDEGTLFSLFQSNISTTAELITYLSTVYFQDATVDQVTTLVGTYPDDPSAGSPFRTGILNNWYPQYKRLAAILGDLTFTLSRRAMLNYTSTLSSEVPSWSYLASYDYGTPVLGTFHVGDILQVFYGILPNYASASIHSYYLSFVYTMNPNNGSNYTEWPQWNDGQQLMQFNSGDSALLADDFRPEPYEFLIANQESLH
ncbi:putative secreted lipase, partial [Lachnellula willkommii]